jgi:short-subunit dehydrogenase
MRKLNLRERTILITGATSGLGRQLALTLAEHEEANLILVGRNESKLKELIDEINRRCSVRTRIVVKDLLAEGSALSLYHETENEDIFGLVNNAGLTYYGPTEASYLDLFTSIIDLDFRCVVELTLLFFNKLKVRSGGFILNITSLASFVPIPYQSIYSAAKAATQIFSECLFQENRDCPVLISTFAPSGIYTDMIERAGLTRHMQKHRFSYIDTERAAKEIISGLKRGKQLIIPGVINRLIYRIMDVIPRRILIVLAGKIYNYEKYRITDARPDNSR